jgi:endonuclease-3 related protein
MISRRLGRIYQKLYSRFGCQHWWPGESPFEVMVGAILTQNTNWANVEKAIQNLKKRKVLSAQRLFDLSRKELAELIRPAGYYNIKAERLGEFLKFLFREYKGSTKKMFPLETKKLRRQLLSVKGIGPETADSILLYALRKPIFVVDAYTRRIFSRHKLIREDFGYDQVQELFMRNLKKSTRLFNEYHALIVRLGKDFCLKTRPRCRVCPLKGVGDWKWKQ